MVASFFLHTALVAQRSIFLVVSVCVCANQQLAMSIAHAIDQPQCVQDGRTNEWVWRKGHWIGACFSTRRQRRSSGIAEVGRLCWSPRKQRCGCEPCARHNSFRRKMWAARVAGLGRAVVDGHGRTRRTGRPGDWPDHCANGATSPPSAAGAIFLSISDRDRSDLLPDQADDLCSGPRKRREIDISW